MAAPGQAAGTAAGSTRGDAAGQARELVELVREQVAHQLGTQGERLTGGLRGLSRQLAQGDTSGMVGQVLTEVGQRVQDLADHLERVGPEGLLAEAREAARRSPGPFLLGVAAAGFLAGRVTKAPTVGQRPGPGSGAVAGAAPSDADPGYDVDAAYETTYDSAPYRTDTGYEVTPEAPPA